MTVYSFLYIWCLCCMASLHGDAARDRFHLLQKFAACTMFTSYGRCAAWRACMVMQHSTESWLETVLL